MLIPDVLVCIFMQIKLGSEWKQIRPTREPVWNLTIKTFMRKTSMSQCV